MVTLEEAVTARLKTHGEVFEVLVDPEGALSYRQGEDLDLEKILAAEDVFVNAGRGDRSSEEDLLRAFETTDFLTIAAKIIKKGEIQLTAEQRKRIIENKRRQVVNVIATNAINPQTGTPHPPARIERAMEEAHVNIDPTKSVEEMVNVTMKAIRPIIPIRFERWTGPSRSLGLRPQGLRRDRLLRKTPAGAVAERRLVDRVVRLPPGFRTFFTASSTAHQGRRDEALETMTI
jgi:ribosome maturation protein SDO1